MVWCLSRVWHRSSCRLNPGLSPASIGVAAGRQTDLVTKKGPSMESWDTIQQHHKFPAIFSRADIHSSSTPLFSVGTAPTERKEHHLAARPDQDIATEYVLIDGVSDGEDPRFLRLRPMKHHSEDDQPQAASNLAEKTWRFTPNYGSSTQYRHQAETKPKTTLYRSATPSFLSPKWGCHQRREKEALGSDGGLSRG